mmetsp:Transcript_12838/g.27593  ORF Transcript_12838/g.27593 Transcript_12838/m.27593 type:complete len:85 (-) Transcript_12838:87-341(-)
MSKRVLWSLLLNTCTVTQSWDVKSIRAHGPPHLVGQRRRQGRGNGPRPARLDLQKAPKLFLNPNLPHPQSCRAILNTPPRLAGF